MRMNLRIGNMTIAEKVRENRLRQVAKRRQCELVKSKRKDPQAWDYGLYWIIAPDGVVGAAGDGIVGGAPGLTIDQVEKWLIKGYCTFPVAS